MTVGKYYCDYCDKEFKDSAVARKRHLQGILHQRNRKLWYDSISFSSQAPLPFGNAVCNRFANTGFCPSGDACKYHHPVHNPQGPAIQGAPGIAGSSQLSGAGSFQGDVARKSFGMSLGNLPPSLMPPPESGYPSLPVVDWG